MYAIIETGGKQYRVLPGDILRVEKLKAEEGNEITFKALWSASGDDAKPASAQNPTATVVAEVLRHVRGPKIIVFKKRIKKAYEKTTGHRQELTEIRIKDIQLS
ncbi:MAG: 50S ribosomal protein L21 [Elusimicrobia bacterium]|nr:50S ribosomal protein L21 [Elusimicrobiota bacterium]